MTNNDDDISVDVDLTYSFTVSGKTSPEFTMSTRISRWLTENLQSLTDDDDNLLFSKVNNGFNENTLKTFGAKPTCDVYINNIDYSTDFDITKPVTVHTIVLFYLKGANNTSYMKVCTLHDYIMQEFATNEQFKELEGIVRDTFIKNSEIMMQPINKKWGVMGAFELSHTLY